MIVFVYVIAGGFLMGLLPGPKPVEMKAGTQMTWVEGRGFVTEPLAKDEAPMVDIDISKWGWTPPPENELWIEGGR